MFYWVVVVLRYLSWQNVFVFQSSGKYDVDRIKQIWYLSPMRAAKVQASLRIRAISPEPLLLAHTSSESRGTFRQKARSLAPLNGWACAVKICHDGMLEDTNSLDAAHVISNLLRQSCRFDKGGSAVIKTWSDRLQAELELPKKLNKPSKRPRDNKPSFFNPLSNCLRV